MALQANVTMTFTPASPEQGKPYRVMDAGIEMTFVCLNPGPGEVSVYTIVLTDAELAAVTTQPQLTTLVRNKLERKYRMVNIASKLDLFIGQSLII